MERIRIDHAFSLQFFFFFWTRMNINGRRKHNVSQTVVSRPFFLLNFLLNVSFGEGIETPEKEKKTCN